MIEVLFGESESASMKVAKNTVVIGKTDGPVSVWIAGKKKTSEGEAPKWIEGTSEEVICLGFLLDIGDIKEEITGRYRRAFIYSMYSQEQWGRDEEIDAELQKMGEAYCNEMTRLQDYLADGESIRVWYSDAPYSLCGFYHLCSILQKYDNEVRGVKLPEHKVRSNFITSYTNWGQVAAEEFAGFLPYEKEISREEIRMYASLWSDLREDNSPLRAVVNGKVMGVPESFYDFIIWKSLTKEPIKEARLLGNILGCNQIGIGDWWYAKRIEAFIEQGKIVVVEDAPNKYARIICKA